MVALPLLMITILCFPAGNDNDVEWNGVSHVPWQDRRPLCPINGEAFTLYFQTYRFDITAARVHVDDGQEHWIDAYWSHDRSPVYAVWAAEVSSTAAPALSYYIELTDGTDTDYYSVNGMSSGPPTDGGFVVNFDTLEHAPLGATPTSDSGTAFKVWAPYPSSAWVRGDFNSWYPIDPMTKYGDYFVVHVANANPREQYKYYFQPNSLWKPDARPRALNPGNNYNTYIEDPFGYQWGDGDYRTPAFEDMIIYELHVGTFAGRNDDVGSGSIPATYADVAAHVDHLVELGINVVGLMPITEFPWDFSAGYNPTTAWAPESIYGAPDDLKAMVDTLHRHGIAVILDIVWNHLSASDNYLWYYDGSQIYFDTPAVETPWGSQADFDRPEVRQYYRDSALYWLEEFHIDGFRMDGTDFMNMYQGSGWGLMQWLNDSIDNRWLDKISVAEQLPDDSWVTRPTSLGGAGFDSQWHDAFVDTLRQEIFDAAFGDPEMWKIRNIINGSGEYLHNTYVVNYLELHDEIWPESGGQRIVKTIDPSPPHDDMWAKGRVKLAQGLVMLAPGIPAIHQGTEWLEDEDFGGGSPSGEDRIDWSKKDTYANIFRYFKDIIAVRKGNGALRADSPHEVFHVNDTGNVIGFHRWDYAGNDIVVMTNFSNTNYTNYHIGFPQPGTWYELINSQATDYDGNGWGNGGSIQTSDTPKDGYNWSAWITIPQMGLLVFRYNHPPDCPGDLDGDNDTDQADLGILLADWGCDDPVNGCAGDLDGDDDTDQSDLGILLADWGCGT